MSNVCFLTLYLFGRGVLVKIWIVSWLCVVQSAIHLVLKKYSNHGLKKESCIFIEVEPDNYYCITNIVTWR